MFKLALTALALLLFLNIAAAEPLWFCQNEVSKCSYPYLKNFNYDPNSQDSFAL
jgi:hypothetical protein